MAAIFKIGNSKDIPEIPDHLSNEAKSFIRLCLQREPSARPTALQLQDHPFIRDQATTRVVNNSITKDAFPYTFDGSRTPVYTLKMLVSFLFFFFSDDFVTLSLIAWTLFFFSTIMKTPLAYPELN